MTNLTNNQEKRGYFAAQNSYRGFVSHFAKLFDSRQFDRIFVLKGGPGTGKSSLMRSLSKELSDIGEITEIFCSSDPKSLDGIIVSGKGGKIAVLDGTAPHERDAVIAGAVDEIVNLGEHWSTDMLVAAREEILLYSREKSMAYKAAYRDLSLAGKYRELLRGEILSRFDSYRAAKFAEELAIGKKKKELPERSLLFSAFGREGYYTLPQALSSVSSAIQITGEYEAPIIFMEILCSTLRAVGIWHEEYPSPLSVGITETVVIYRDKGAAAYTLLPAKEKLSVNRFLRPLSAAQTELAHFEKERLDYEELARGEFARAAVAHFALEKIYTPTVNFEKIDEEREKIKEKALKIL